MNKIICGLLGALALVTTASTSVAAAPVLTDGAQVQTVQFFPHRHYRPFHRHYRPHGYFRRPLFGHGYHRGYGGPGRFRGGYR